MTNITDEMIRQAAYYLWENAGRPSGNGVEFWNKACAEIYGMHKTTQVSCDSLSEKSHSNKMVKTKSHNIISQSDCRAKKIL